MPGTAWRQAEICTSSVESPDTPAGPSSLRNWPSQRGKRTGSACLRLAHDPCRQQPLDLFAPAELGQNVAAVLPQIRSQ
jgi:hypothetical protein